MLKRQSISFWDEQLQMDNEEVHLHKTFMLGVIWAEKMHFVRRAIEENPFDSDKFVWCDAGIMRTAEDMQAGFMFACNPDVISDTHMHILQVGEVEDVKGKWWVPKSRDDVRFGGGILGAHRDVWHAFIPLYESTMDELIADGVCVFKDQVVYANMVLHHPTLFHVVEKIGHWFHLLRAWSSVPSESLNTYIINLEHRRDRWKETVEAWNLEKYSNVFRFPALKHKEHSLSLDASIPNGCTGSHLSLIALNPHRTFCVLEDDADPIPGVTLQTVLDLVAEIEHEDRWHFANLGTSTLSGLHAQTFAAVRSFHEKFWETKISSTTHAMAYSARMHTLLRPILDAVTKAFFSGSPEAVIDYAIGSGLVLDETPVQVVPKHGILSVQRKSHSDLNNSTADYTFMFQLVNAQLASLQHAWTPVLLPVVVDMWGGLGNQLFMAAAALQFALESGRPFALLRKVYGKNPHSETNYMDTVFRRFPQIQELPDSWCVVCHTYDDVKRVSGPLVPKLRNYFQDAENVTESFKDMLEWPQPKDFPDDKDAVIIHIRGGDYRNIPVHAVDLNDFRRKALSLCPTRKRVLVSTNDVPYSKKVLKQLSISHAEMLESTDELQTLAWMAQSDAPLIGSNSTFSWWAAALTPAKRARLRVLPQEWFSPGYSPPVDPQPLFYLPGVVVL